MMQPGQRDPYRRDLRPWSDPLIQAAPADDPYSMAAPEEEPILAELADASPPQQKIEPIDDFCWSPAQMAPEEFDFRFSLRDLMLLVTAAAVLFALMGQLPRPVFAGVAGGLSLLVLAVLSFVEVTHPVLKMGWWLLFAVYLIASLTAAFQG